MKTKINILARGKSNPPRGINLPPSALLEEETKKMEQKLKELKEIMALEQAKRSETNTPQHSASGSRWKSANDKVPLKNFAKAVLENKIRTHSNINQVTNDKENVSSKQTILGSSQSAVRLESSSIENPKVVQNDEPISKVGRQPIAIVHGIQNQRKMNENVPSLSTINNIRPSINPEAKAVSANVTIEVNLKSPLNNQNNPMTYTGTFLRDIGLSQYSEIFQQNGFDEKEILMELTTKHLVDMKIPAGHQIKIMKNLDRLRQNSLITATKLRKNESSISFQEQKNDLVELGNQNTIEIDEIGLNKKMNEENPLKTEFKKANHHGKSFESLIEPNNTKGVTIGPLTISRKDPKLPGVLRNNRPDSKTKSVRFSEDTHDFEKKENINFFKHQPKDSISIASPSIKETSTGIDAVDLERMRTNKKSCWNCFTRFDETKGYIANDKVYCNENCYNDYKLLNSVKCANKSCQKIIMKNNAEIRKGLWYCNEKCASVIQEIPLDGQDLMNTIIEGDEKIKDDFLNEKYQEGFEDITYNLEAFNFDLPIGKLPDVPTLEELGKKYCATNIKKQDSVLVNNLDDNKVSQYKIKEKLITSTKNKKISLDDSLEMEQQEAFFRSL